MIYEVMLVDCLFSFRGANPLIASIRQQSSSLDVVLQTRIQDFLFQVGPQSRIADWGEQFDPLVKVALRPVGAPDIDFFFSAVEEVEDSGVLQKSTDYAGDVIVSDKLGTHGLKVQLREYQAT